MLGKLITSITDKFNINAEQLYIIYLLHTDKKRLLEYESKINCKYETMQYLHRKQFIRFMSADMDNVERLDYIELSDKGKLLVQDREFTELFTEEESSDIDDLVDKFREKFPDGVSNQYGKRFRGTLGMVKKNLEKFKKEFKYSDEIILLATEKMVTTMVSKGKKEYISQAHYFIYHKDRGSELAEECENVLKGDVATSSSFDEQI
jgi:hypothetical protein